MSVVSELGPWFHRLKEPKVILSGPACEPAEPLGDLKVSPPGLLEGRAECGISILYITEGCVTVARSFPAPRPPAGAVCLRLGPTLPALVRILRGLRPLGPASLPPPLASGPAGLDVARTLPAQTPFTSWSMCSLWSFQACRDLYRSRSHWTVSFSRI